MNRTKENGTRRRAHITTSDEAAKDEDFLKPKQMPQKHGLWLIDEIDKSDKSSDGILSVTSCDDSIHAVAI